MLSLVLDEDVIAAPGLGQVPGIVAIVFATVAFAAGLWAAVRMPASVVLGRRLDDGGDASSPTSSGSGSGAVVTGADLAVAVAVAGRIATTWFGVVDRRRRAACAAWGGIALVRTGASRPRWPWEDEFDE